MRTISATEASRHFSHLLDAVEAGESVTVRRGGRPIARISPVPRHTGRDLRLALERLPQADDDLARDIARGLEAVSDEIGDPWADD